MAVRALRQAVNACVPLKEESDVVRATPEAGRKPLHRLFRVPTVPDGPIVDGAEVIPEGLDLRQHGRSQLARAQAADFNRSELFEVRPIQLAISMNSSRMSTSELRMLRNQDQRIRFV